MTFRLGSRRIHVQSVVVWLLALALALISFLPIVWIFLTSFKTNVQTQLTPPIWIPDFTNIDAYVVAFVSGESQVGSALGPLIHSLVVATGTMIVTMVLGMALAIPLGLDARWTSGTWALEGAAATDADTAALTGGHRGAVGQRHGRVAAVPADVQRAWRGAGQEATGAQGGLFVAGVEPVSVDGPAGGGVGHPGRQSGAVSAACRVSAGDVRRTRNLVDQSQQRCGRNSKHDDER